MKRMTGIDIFEQLPGYIGWKDNYFRYMGCNGNMADVLQLKSTDKIIGLADVELCGYTEELVKFHDNNDQLAVKGQTIRCVHKSDYPYDGSFFYFVKKPMLDSENKIVGLIFHCQEMKKSSVFEHLHRSDKKFCPEYLLPSHYQIGSHHENVNLSDRELECMFLLLRGMTAKQIGERICLSKRTVESYIENIKSKFGCQNKSELLVLAINKGFMNIMPPRFFENNFINIVN